MTFTVSLSQVLAGSITVTLPFHRRYITVTSPQVMTGSKPKNMHVFGLERLLPDLPDLPELSDLPELPELPGADAADSEAGRGGQGGGGSARGLLTSGGKEAEGPVVGVHVAMRLPKAMRSSACKVM